MSHIYKLAPPMNYASSTLRVLGRIGNGAVINQQAWPAPDPVIPPPPPVPEPLPSTQDETVVWLGRLSALGATAPSNAVVSAANTLIARFKAGGLHDALIDYCICTPADVKAQFEGVKGIVHYSDFILAEGTLVTEELLGTSSPDGARFYWNKKATEIAGFTDSRFGMGCGITSNFPGTWNEMGFFEQAAAIQLSLRSSGGFRAGAWLTATQVLFGGSNSAGVRGIYQTDANTAHLASWDTLTASTDVATGNAATRLPASELTLFAGGRTGNTKSPNRIGIWWLGYLTAEQHDVAVKAIQEMWQALDVFDSIQVEAPEVGPNAFSAAAISAVTPADLDILQLYPPPARDTTTSDTYPAFPVSTVVCRAQPSVLASTWTPSAARGGAHSQFIWCNVGEADTVGGPMTGRIRPNDNNPPPTINLANGVSARSAYRTKRRARGATLVQAAWNRNYAARNEPLDPLGQGYLDIAEAFDLDPALVQEHSYWEANKAAFFTTPYPGAFVAYDIVILDTTKQITLTNFARHELFMDLEPVDTPGDSLFIEFMLRFGQIAQVTGASFFYSSHPLNELSGFRDGFNLTTCPQLMQSSLIPWYTVSASHNQQTGGTVIDAVEAQINLARGVSGTEPVDMAKVALQVQIGGPSSNIMTDTECAMLRSWYVDNGIKRLFLSRAGSSIGGPMSRYYNQKRAILLGLPLA